MDNQNHVLDFEDSKGPFLEDPKGVLKLALAQIPELTGHLLEEIASRVDSSYQYEHVLHQPVTSDGYRGWRFGITFTLVSDKLDWFKLARGDQSKTEIGLLLILIPVRGQDPRFGITDSPVVTYTKGERDQAEITSVMKQLAERASAYIPV